MAGVGYGQVVTLC
jgi:RecA-family ATPase